MTTNKKNPTLHTSRMHKAMLFGSALLFSSVLGFGTLAVAHPSSASEGIAPASAASVNSAKHEDPQERINERVAKMTKKLSLTDQQAAQVRDILTKNQPKMKADHQALKSATDANKAAAKAQMLTDKQATMSEIRAVLNPDQQAKFDAFQAKHQKHD